MRERLTPFPKERPLMHRYLIVTCALVLVIIGMLTFAFSGKTQSPSSNVASAANGAIASASSEHSTGNFPVSAGINGDRKAQNWGAGGGWNENTQGDYSSDILTVNFPASNFVRQINVFTLRD